MPVSSTINTMMLKPYKVLDCKNLVAIQTGVLTYLKLSGADSLNLHKGFSWNFISVKEFAKNNPLIIEWFKEFNLSLRDIAVTITRTNEGLDKHRDELPVITKINFPILNTSNTYNLWWDDNDNLIARHEMLMPVAFNARLNHAVEMTEQSSYPRIVLSCMFFKEPTYMLE